MQHYYGHYRLSIRDALNRFSRKPFQCGGLKGFDQLVAIEQHLQQRLGLWTRSVPASTTRPSAVHGDHDGHSSRGGASDAHFFLTRVEHYLAEVPDRAWGQTSASPLGPHLATQPVQQELERMFSDLAQQFKTSRLAWQMTRKWRYISKAWLPDILHCYDIPGLPRSNLDLESAFGSLRRGQRRTSGKETALVRVFGPGEVVLLSLEEKDILPLLQSVPADVYWSQRRRQEEREEPRRWLRRLHRDPVRALTQIDQQFYQVVNAHTRASADAL